VSIPIIIDTDPGGDDAVALLLAAAGPEVELLAITVAADLPAIKEMILNRLRSLR
jgi:inosine-uridine nucleoside N-ribohydrolase